MTTPDTAWATLNDVTTITGRTVSPTLLAQAQSVVTIYANRTPGMATLKARDLYWLKQAVAWQAAWLPDQPGYSGRSQTYIVIGDGVHTATDTEWATTLAPLAARAIKNLSWKADRTRRGRNVRHGTGDTRVDFGNEAADDLHPWTPLGVGC